MKQTKNSNGHAAKKKMHLINPDLLLVNLITAKLLVKI
jgi:hypothetical protein